MTLKDEKARLRSDYPHLTPQFEGMHGDWECHLMTETRMFGLFGIERGSGKTKIAALLDARSGIDEAVAEAARCKAEKERLAEEAAAREKALDDAMFASI
ncbi:hypothetical protein OIU34_16700 [Pararhizobium sp. BT-229]|uniref:hypothetical protein n=1 Tax=Pararhizobium sp. BT-229 TaxID=2986923 RepID=UPI0021F73C9F|nr:hypothetical protein [Pararhizobium sp. BT-229]MCV9963544.1 hypothetical protein [Pararhizobium sp. BT-229]